MLPEKRAKKKYNDRWNKLEVGHRKLLTADYDGNGGEFIRSHFSYLAESKQSLGARQARTCAYFSTNFA